MGPLLGTNRRQEAILSRVTIPQVTARQGLLQVSSRFVCTHSLPSRSNRDVKSHVSCVGAEVIGFKKDLQNNLADLKPCFGGQKCTSLRYSLANKEGLNAITVFKLQSEASMTNY